MIAESHHFPELRERTFDFGTVPVLQALGRYLREAHSAGSADIDDPDLVSAQFLGMIASALPIAGDGAVFFCWVISFGAGLGDRRAATEPVAGAMVVDE
ncbi:TetR/AcrR family transcriptional regulator C-terminal domain-containing protein [Nonomuraea sp. NPDC004580]|uniref:TetR/AcrR family transcriptional regulator C-terminal domain-containing protein n=1 Tax=Nonomuraea sp. NPDC004580 TaxID=3154552 RepID=UPI0033A7ED6A